MGVFFNMSVDKTLKILLSTVCPPWGCVCGCGQVPRSAKKCFSWYITYAKWGEKCQLVLVCFEKCFWCVKIISWEKNKMYYRLKSDAENFRNYRLPKKLSAIESTNISESYDGRSHKSTYMPIRFEMTLESEKEYPIADFQDSHMALCSEKTKNVIEEICDENEVEFFPCNLEGENEIYFIMNILGQEDCVDYEKSKFTRFPSNPNKIMFFEHIEFKEKINRHFFRIKDLKFQYFISEEAKEMLEKAGLKGLIFDDSLFI